MKNLPISTSLFRNTLLSLILTTLLITLCYFWADPAFAFWVDHENWKRFPIFDYCTHLADLIVIWAVLYYFYFAWSFSKQKKQPLEFQKNLCPGLTRIFHTGSSRGAANPDADTTGGRETAGETSGSERVNEGDGLRRRLYVSYCPRSNSKLTQYPSGVRKPQQNRYEISGLTRIFHRS
ncbi:MAG: hypothetical protein K9M81_04150 [Chthoniobacterales bacterium]|nr:hypothetical protein [Chthoniobacterales bacterium]